MLRLQERKSVAKTRASGKLNKDGDKKFYYINGILRLGVMLVCIAFEIYSVYVLRQNNNKNQNMLFSVILEIII